MATSWAKFCTNTGVVALAICVMATSATASCRQALALGLDVSGSVDGTEYRLQLDGLAGALEDPQVTEALLSIPVAPVEIAIFEWSGPLDQRLILAWTPITSRETLSQVAQALRGARRSPAQQPATAIGAAMLYGADLLAQRPNCWQHTIDLSGDGQANTGIRPRDAASDPRLDNITINGLAIGADTLRGDDLRQLELSELSSYYRAEVIQGFSAFVETAIGFEDFEQAMIRKLLRELEGLALSQLNQ